MRSSASSMSVAPLALLHFFWMRAGKNNFAEVGVYAAILALLLAWRTGLQALDSREYGDVSTLLSIPLWIPLLFIVPSLLLLAMCALARVFELYQRPGGRP